MDDEQVIAVAARRYADWWQTLSPARVDDIQQLVSPAVRFRDPFNDVVGIDAMRRVLAKMFDDVPDAAFTITDIGMGEVVYLRWQFRGGRFSAEGVSEIKFGPDGRVVSHIDHWDSGTAVYAQLPVIGALVRMIRRKIGAH